MNAITATALTARHRKLPSITNLARKLGDFIAPRDHAGKGKWDKEADIPLWAWPASLGFAMFFLFGPEILGRLLRLVS